MSKDVRGPDPEDWQFVQPRSRTWKNSLRRKLPSKLPIVDVKLSPGQEAGQNINGMSCAVSSAEAGVV